MIDFFYALQTALGPLMPVAFLGILATGAYLAIFRGGVYTKLENDSLLAGAAAGLILMAGYFWTESNPTNDYLPHLLVFGFFHAVVLTWIGRAMYVLLK